MPGTRIDILKSIYEWIDGEENTCIFWLSGWAGTGKSAIARTVGRHYHNEGRLAASFFFSKGGGESSHASMFVTTIAHQLASNKRLKALGVEQQIRDCLKERTQIENETLRDQWDQLVLQPLSRHEEKCGYDAFVLVVDALDECQQETSVETLLRLLPQLGRLANIRMRILVTGRPETPIRHGFREMQAGAHQGFVLHSIPSEVSDRDIRVFLQYHLRNIATMRGLHDDWPGEQATALMVKHAQGLFIWAETARRFITKAKNQKSAERRVRLLLEPGSDL